MHPALHHQYIYRKNRQRVRVLILWDKQGFLSAIQAVLTHRFCLLSLGNFSPRIACMYRSCPISRYIRTNSYGLAGLFRFDCGNSFMLHPFYLKEEHYNFLVTVPRYIITLLRIMYIMLNIILTRIRRLFRFNYFEQLTADN